MIVDADGCPLWVEVEGPAQAPVLMLSNSLGTDLHMWDAQVAALAQRFRLVRYDRRGHGKSGMPAGPYTMERLGRDALAIADGLRIAKFDWCGLSMGGMVGMWLAAHAPQRIDRLILSNASCHYPDPSYWNEIPTRATGTSASRPLQRAAASHRSPIASRRCGSARNFAQARRRPSRL
jgi:3-oxoadipate enol-lactonase